MHNYDLIILTETWLSDSDDLDQYAVKDYDLYHSNSGPRCRSKGRLSGGIAIYVKSHLTKAITIQKEKKGKKLWLQISHEQLNLDEDLFLCACYIPPERSNRDDKLWEQLERDLIDIPNHTYYG